MVAQTRNSPSRGPIGDAERRDDNQLKQELKSIAQARSNKKAEPFDWQAYFFLFLIICVTVFAYPIDLGYR
jgi:hypothetical protein